MWWGYLGREGPWGVGFLPRDEGLGTSLLLVGYLDGGNNGRRSGSFLLNRLCWGILSQNPHSAALHKGTPQKLQ